MSSPRGRIKKLASSYPRTRARARGAAEESSSPAPPADSPPPSPPAGPRASISSGISPRKVIPPRYVDFPSLASWFPELQPLFHAQGWIGLLSAHRSYSPPLIEEFFANLSMSKHNTLQSTVHGHRVRITPRTIAKALCIPNSGVVISDCTDYDFSEAYCYMAGLEADEVTNLPRVFNANRFPPFSRLVHHIVTTMIIPKAGSHDEVTDPHFALFYHLFRHEQINFPELMVDVLTQCLQPRKRSRPYAAYIYSFLLTLGISHPGSSQSLSWITGSLIYDQSKCHQMGFALVDGVVLRTREHAGLQARAHAAAPAPPSPLAHHDTYHEPSSHYDPHAAGPSSSAHPAPEATYSHAYDTPPQWWSSFYDEFGQLRSQVADFSSQMESLNARYEQLAIEVRNSNEAQERHYAEMREAIARLSSSSAPPPFDDGKGGETGEAAAGDDDDGDDDDEEFVDA